LTSRTNARNTTQTPGTIDRIAARVVNSSTGLYTVPAGKKARITDMEMQVIVLGADATCHIAFKRGAVFTEISNPVTATVPNNIVKANALTLIAGDILTNIGDAGAENTTTEMSATIEEFQA